MKVELVADDIGGMFLELKMRVNQRGRDHVFVKRIEYDCIDEKRKGVFKVIAQTEPEEDEDMDDELYEGLEIVRLENPE